MNKILISYLEMMVGGSTTSLISILNNIDYEKYEVDLLLYNNSGELMNQIPGSVNILKQACKAKTKIGERLRKILSPVSLFQRVKSEYISHREKNSIVISQIMCYENARLSRRIEKEYDIAIAFLEGWPCDYVSKYVKSKKKIAWIHVDYIGAGFIPEIDKKMFSSYDNIINVSSTCAKNFKSVFPSLKDKVEFIENISSVDLIKSFSREEINDFSILKDKINLISVCRISLRHKGLDRGVEVIKKLMEKDNIDVFRWYIVGDGEDMKTLQLLINKYELGERVFLLGKKLNPFPYEINMDAFFLPSRYEGKPMAVTEAMILGLPAIVTEYASAHTQINNGVNGIVIDNNIDALYKSMKKLSDGILLKKLKCNINENPISFNEQMSAINKLLD